MREYYEILMSNMRDFHCFEYHANIDQERAHRNIENSAIAHVGTPAQARIHNGRKVAKRKTNYLRRRASISKRGMKP
jgi:hypothetical protein